MKRILFLPIFVCIVFSCDKENYTTVPNFEVRFEVKLETLDFELKTNLAYKEITQPRTALERVGYGGLLLINGMGDAQVNIYAYDLSCPVEAQRSVRVVPDNQSSASAAVKTAVTATCLKCGAVYYIATGTGAPQSGTKYRLRPYRVVNSGYGTFTVVN